MNDLFQIVAGLLFFCGFAENFAAQCRPINVVSVVQNGFAEPLSKLLNNVVVGEDSMSDGITVEDGEGTAFCQPASDGALARANATNQADHGNA